MAGEFDKVEILLVEGNPTDAELCIRALRNHNLANDLLWVKDGEETLDFLFQQGDYADRKGETLKVVLLDLRLPKIGGLEVLRRLRADSRTKLLPVVVLTSSREEPDISQSYYLGANSFISKPVSFDEFADTVAKLGLYWLMVNRPPSRH